MHIVFDLDGVVIDTGQVIARCYEAAGVTPPDNILAHENSDWLLRQCAGLRARERASEIRRQKNIFYQNMIRAGVVDWLPGAFVASELNQEGHRVHLLSGAPSGTISLVKERWSYTFPHRPWPFSLITDGMRTPDKMKTIALLARSSRSRGVYVDDQDKFIDLPEGWGFVHVTDELNHVGRLYAKILREGGER
jgi:phosphoglycolate phosphatase-like HAD superfamily hydrolase